MTGRIHWCLERQWMQGETGQRKDQRRGGRKINEQKWATERILWLTWLLLRWLHASYKIDCSLCWWPIVWPVFLAICRSGLLIETTIQERSQFMVNLYLAVNLLTEFNPYLESVVDGSSAKDFFFPLQIRCSHSNQLVVERLCQSLCPRCDKSFLSALFSLSLSLILGQTSLQVNKHLTSACTRHTWLGSQATPTTASWPGRMRMWRETSVHIDHLAGN